MDHFGIGAAMKCMAMTYIQGARRTGRTTSLLASLKDGDQVICVDTHQTKLLQRQCTELGLKVGCKSVSPERIWELSPMYEAKGRTLFDHAWVEQYYVRALERAKAEIDQLQSILSTKNPDEPVSRGGRIEVEKWKY